MLAQRLTRRKIILLVESNQALAKLLHTTIAQHTPHGAVGVSTGEEALRVLRTTIPDLVILNANLSDMTGAHLCAQIRRIEKLKSLPLLLVGTDRPVEEALGLGLPLRLDAFLQALAHLLRA